LTSPRFLWGDDQFSTSECWAGLFRSLCRHVCCGNIIQLQIWKEVDGIFTADPMKIPSARLLPTITLEEASELTYYGSEVIHPFTTNQIRHANIPLRLKNVKNPTANGTIIYPSQSSGSSTPSALPNSHSPSPPAMIPNPVIYSFMSANGYYSLSQSRRIPSAIISKDSIVLINVQSNRESKSHGFLVNVFGTLDKLQAVADLITSSEQSVSLALSSLESEDSIRRVCEGLSGCGKVEIMREMAIVSVIGHKMRNMVGIAGEKPNRTRLISHLHYLQVKYSQLWPVEV